MQNINQLLQKNPLVRMVQKENFVGWIYSIDYDSALVMTNDIWKAEALGIPHNSFLIAATFDPEDFAKTPVEDQEVILLRVIGSAGLPQNDDIVRTKIDHYKDQPGIFAADGAREFDDITQNEMQFGGITCRVLGTFYSQNDELWLGSDLESFASAARYYVYRPRGAALRLIVNHVDPLRRRAARDEAQQLGIERNIEPFPIGTVRYTSTDRLHRRDIAERVEVAVQPSDFLSRRTAVLGMTRTGKSNTIKQLVSVVRRIADEAAVKIGQIIYDINGEYANANRQDEGALADVYEDTVRYRMLETDGFRDLRNDFYVYLNEGFSIIRRELEESGRIQQSDYIRKFVEISFDEPDPKEVSAHQRWERTVAAYQVLLHRAGFQADPGLRIKFTANAQVKAAVAAAGATATPGTNPGVSLEEAFEWFAAAREANQQSTLQSSTPGKPWIDDTLATLLDMIVQRSSSNNSYISGYRVLAPSVKYHAPGRTEEVADEIYGLLALGKIVILDLSVGDPTMRENISKQVASKIFHESMGYFINGKTPPNIIVYIEEAHNLIGKGQELTDIWPRLAKEGAKYRIGLVYATQEVSSVHPNILANTENWFVSHLNNDREIGELSRFYDFSDFSRSLIRAQNVGFARVKTLSSPFVIPVQLDKFDPSTERARTRGAVTGEIS